MSLCLQDLAARNALESKNEACKVAGFGLAREMVDGIYKVNKVSVSWITMLTCMPVCVLGRKQSVRGHCIHMR